MKYQYQHLVEFFKLSTWDEDVQGSFGLQPPPGDWAVFKEHIDRLNTECEAEGSSIKVIYAARHGQAEHNILSEKYNLPESTVQLTHPILDPPLTALGRDQASHLAIALERESKKGMPIPSQWFVSPMTRTGETCGLEWGWVHGSGDPSEGIEVGEKKGDRGRGVPAIVVENLREHLHVNLCDSRRSLSELSKDFPSYTYDPSIPDLDTIWKPAEERGRETEDELVERLGRALEEVLDLNAMEAGKSGEKKAPTYISITSHSGALRGLYKALGITPTRFVVGQMNVLVVKVKKLS